IVGSATVGTQRAASLQNPPDSSPPSNMFAKVESGSLSAIVRSFKSAVTKRINEVRDTPGAPVWQGRFYDKIIRNETMLNAIQQYIEANPANWAFDEENLLKRQG